MAHLLQPACSSLAGAACCCTRYEQLPGFCPPVVCCVRSLSTMHAMPPCAFCSLSAAAWRRVEQRGGSSRCHCCLASTGGPPARHIAWPHPTGGTVQSTVRCAGCTRRWTELCLCGMHACTWPCLLPCRWPPGCTSCIAEPFAAAHAAGLRLRALWGELRMLPCWPWPSSTPPCSAGSSSSTQQAAPICSSRR